MAITSDQAKILNQSDAGTQRANLGDSIKDAYNNGAVVITYNVAADATSGLSISVPEACEIVDVIVQARAASGSGTLTLRSGTNAITDAIACAVDTTVARAGTIDDAYSSITTSTSLNVISNGSADRGLITIIGFRS